MGFTAYPGYPLRGNSAEWVIERPSVGGSLTTLTNYTRIPFWDSYAYTEASVFYDIANGYAIDMTDNTGNVISYPEYIGVEGFVRPRHRLRLVIQFPPLDPTKKRRQNGDG